MTTVLDRLLLVTTLLGDDMTGALEREGLTTARTHLLWQLVMLGPSTQQALAVALDVTPRNVTGLVDGLEQTGFVTREPHPSDRRAILVTPTERAATLMARMQGEHAELSIALVEGLSPREVVAFEAALDVVTANLQRLLAEQP
ncbi:MarR family transcriptional regulator [Agromyces atrinae]|uniref:MarR family winged helix-turn-helix transcriptional regulator n=1 Tax=Agromyces atrinae TaxID=592376 RepID=UPI001F59595E|nr:MarR family transcriptional regulator [Agromyces atrinae]MCI2957436.1 MarR family transcriptional regulator [Agromyces atrinae]